MGDKATALSDAAQARLRRYGFNYHDTQRRIVLARVLPPEEAPMHIETSYDNLIAEAGYYILYRPGDQLRDEREAYQHWPVRPDLFHATYKLLDEPGWQPSPQEAHLMSLGCTPYLRTAGVWAKQLSKGATVTSLESVEPVIVPAGAWLCVGYKGEPYSMRDEDFRVRYIVED